MGSKCSRPLVYPLGGIVWPGRTVSLGVILSDEVAAATEESKDPYVRQQSQPCCCAKGTHCDFSQL